MYCGNCGQNIERIKKYCPKCGKKLKRSWRIYFGQIKRPIIVGAILIVVLFGVYDYFYQIALFRYIIVHDELTVAEIKTISNSIGSIICPGKKTDSEYEGPVAGSGTYLSLHTNVKNLNVFITNEHVAQLHSDEFSNFNKCSVDFSSDGKIQRVSDSAANRIGFHYNANSIRRGDLVDLAILSADVIDNVADYLNDDEENKGVTKEDLLKSLDSHLLDTNRFGVCKVKNPIGMKVYVFGYPSSSETVGSSDVESILSYRERRHLVVSEGIISGKEGNNYFTTALIDTGSSGGLAVIKYRNKPCILGIPTWGSVGELTTLGVIQPFSNVFSAGFEWENID